MGRRAGFWDETPLLASSTDTAFVKQSDMTSFLSQKAAQGMILHCACSERCLGILHIKGIRIMLALYLTSFIMSCSRG